MNTLSQEHQLEIVPNQWYIIFLSSNLKNKPVSVRRLGQDLVLWRDEEGVIHCAGAACPHRGANLGLGKIVDGELQCKYHGFCFNTKGLCTKTPCEGKDAIIPNSLNLDIVKTKEKNGFIWLWYGDTEPDREIPEIEGAFKKTSGATTFDFIWDVRLSRVVEGMLDLHHIPFAHQPWLPANLTRLDPYEVNVKDNVIYTRGCLRDEDNPEQKLMAAEMNIAFPGFMHMKFGFTDKKTDSTRYGFEMVGSLTPVDENSTWIAIYYRQSYVTFPLLSQLFNFIALQFDWRLIQPDDYLLLKSSQPNSSSLETNHLVRADRGIAEWHRLQKIALDSHRKEHQENAKTEIQKFRGGEKAAHSGCGIA